MAGVRRFEDLKVYQLAVELRRRVLQLSSRGPVTRDFEFVRQVRNSARGAPRNISEGYSRFVPSEMRHFLSYAKASLDETKNHIEDARECSYFTEEECAALLALTERTLASINRLMRYLESPQAAQAYERLRRAQRGAEYAARKPRRSADE